MDPGIMADIQVGVEVGAGVVLGIQGMVIHGGHGAIHGGKEKTKKKKRDLSQSMGGAMKNSNRSASILRPSAICASVLASTASTNAAKYAESSCEASSKRGRGSLSFTDKIALMRGSYEMFDHAGSSPMLARAHARCAMKTLRVADSVSMLMPLPRRYVIISRNLSNTDILHLTEKANAARRPGFWFRSSGVSMLRSGMAFMASMSTWVKPGSAVLDFSPVVRSRKRGCDLFVLLVNQPSLRTIAQALLNAMWRIARRVARADMLGLSGMIIEENTNEYHKNKKTIFVIF